MSEVFNKQHLRSGQFGAHKGSRKPTGVLQHGEGTHEVDTLLGFPLCIRTKVFKISDQE